MAKSRKKNRNVSRDAPKKEPYDLVLIVCEGTKTEPFYFQNLRDTEKLSSVNVQINSGADSDPVAVVQTAKETIDEQAKYLPFDRVFCVIDRDSHSNFENAKKMAEDNKIGLIVSYPCFEYWYLCHFVFSRTPIVASGKKSAGGNCVTLLNQHWQKEFNVPYEKNIQNIYLHLYEKLDFAIKNAQTALSEANADNEPNPSTKVHILVDYLRNIKKTAA